MLIIAQKVKPNKIKLFRWAYDEKESYTLLKLTSEEAKQLIRADKDGWITKNVNGVSEYIRDVSPAIQKVWLDLAALHKSTNPEFGDVSKKYISEIPGTSCLIRDINTHTIKIARRTPGKKCNINLLHITDRIREKFFDDAHHTLLWKLQHKYGVSIEDEELYNKWSKFMTDSYFKNINK